MSRWWKCRRADSELKFSHCIWGFKLRKTPDLAEQHFGQLPGEHSQQYFPQFHMQQVQLHCLSPQVQMWGSVDAQQRVSSTVASCLFRKLKWFFMIVPMKYQVQGNFGQSVTKTQLVHLFPKSWGCMGAAIVLWKLFLTSIADEGCPGCSSSGERMGMILAQEARCLLDIPEAFEWLMWFIAIVLFLEQTINHWQGWLNKTWWWSQPSKL